MLPPLIGGDIKRWCCLTSVGLSDVWCLSVAYIGPKSRTERPRKTKIGTEVAHVTRDSDTTFKVRRSKAKVTRPVYSPPCWRVRQLQRWAWERDGRGKLLLRCRRRRKALRRPRGGEGRGISWRPPAYRLYYPAPLKLRPYGAIEIRLLLLLLLVKRLQLRIFIVLPTCIGELRMYNANKLM